MIKEKPQKNRKKYYCKKCDYTSRDKKDFRRHCLTTKHKKGNHMITNDNPYMCECCFKTYKYSSGLSRHKKICKKKKTAKNRKITKKTAVEAMKTEQPTSVQNQEVVGKISEIDAENIQLTTDLVVKMLKQQNTLQQQLVDLCKERQQVINYQNCGNKKMTINVFLNEKVQRCDEFNRFCKSPRSFSPRFGLYRDPWLCKRDQQYLYKTSYPYEANRTPNSLL